MRLWVAGCLLVVLSCDDAQPDSGPQSTAATPAPLKEAVAEGPRVVILTTRPGATQTELRLQPVGASAPAAPVAWLTHLPDGEVRGRLAAESGRVFVVAETEPGRDRSFGSSLWSLGPGVEPRKIATSVVYASRPLALDDGSVVVQRGSPGAPPSQPDVEAGHLRTDALRVDLFENGGGNARTLHEISGYTTHLAGAYQREVLLYRVWFQHADLVSVHVDTGAVRTLASSIPPLARDFSVDVKSGFLYYANHDASGWYVARLQLKSGETVELSRAEDMRVTPSFWPSGGVMVNDSTGGTVLGGSGPARPLGAGFDEVRADANGWVALQHHVPGKFSVPYVYSAESKRVHVLALPHAARHSVAGVLP